MTKSLKSICGFMLMFALVFAATIILSACGEKPAPAAEKYTVTFYVGDTVYTTQQVTKNRRATEPTDPTFAEDYKHFTAWYKDQAFTQVWDFSVDIVTQNTSLYAGYREIRAYPTEVRMANEPCTSKILWTQQALSTGTYTVLIDGVATAGTTTFDEESFTVTFTPTVEVAGGLHDVTVQDSQQAGHDAVAEDLRFGGAGTNANPYLVYSSLDFEKINKENVEENTYFKLQGDITISTHRPAQKDFVFNGILNGDGYTLTVAGNTAAIYKIGTSGQVRAIVLAGSISTDVNDSVGALADFNLGTVEKINSTASVTSTAGNTGSVGLANALDETLADGEGNRGIAGGIVGTNKGTISNCHVVTTASTNGVVKAAIGGGIVAGYNFAGATISDCISEGCIGAWNAKEVGKSTSAYSYSGGIAGINAGTIQKSSLEGSGKVLAQRYTTTPLAEEQTTNNSNLGGIVGYNMQGGVISKCANSAIRVHGDENIGGIAGLNAGSITDCMSEGLLKSTNVSSYVGARINAGGIVGKMETTGTVTNCMSTVDVICFTASTAYSLAERATNSLYITALPLLTINPDYGSTDYPRTGMITTLVAPQGEGNAEVIYTISSAKNVLVADSYRATINGNNAFKFDSDASTIKLNVTRPVEETITVHLFDGTTEIKANAPVSEMGTVLKASKTGFKLLGWAKTNGGEVVFPAGQAVTCYAIRHAGISEGGNLYAVWEALPIPSEDLVVVVYIKQSETSASSYFDETVAQTAINQFKAANPDANYNIKYYTFIGKVGPLGEFINDMWVDVVMGAGTNLQTQGGVAYISRSNYANAPSSITGISTYSSRYSYVLTDRDAAVKFQAFTTGTENASAQVKFSVGGVESDAVILNSILANSANMPVVAEQTGKEFVGWAITSNPDLSDASSIKFASTKLSVNYNDVKTLLTESSVTLYAILTDVATVTFDVDGVTTNKTLTVVRPITDMANPSKEDFAFVGWALSDTATEADILAADTASISWATLATLDSNFENNKATTLYAVFVSAAKSATITFNNDGVTTDKEVTDTVPITTMTNPEKEDYTFLGWALSSTATTADILAADTASISWDTLVALSPTLEDDGALTLYAVFQANAYDVYIAVWERYFHEGKSSANTSAETKINAYVTAFKAIAGNENANVRVKIYEGTSNNTGYWGVDTFVSAVNANQFVDVVLGTKLTTASGSPTFSGVPLGNLRTDVADASINENRGAALLKSTSDFAVNFFAYVTNQENITAQVSFVVGTDEPVVKNVNSITLNKENVITVTVPTGKTFAGWALSADADPTVAENIKIAADKTQIDYSDVSAILDANHQVTLYAIFADE